MDLDITFLVQAFVVISALAFIGPLLFRPMLELIELREKSIAGAREEGQRLLTDTESKEHELAAKLEGARRAALVERQKLIDEARETERRLLEKARADAQKQMEAARNALASSAKTAGEKLQVASKDLARMIAVKLLARDVA